MGLFSAFKKSAKSEKNGFIEATVTEVKRLTPEAVALKITPIDTNVDTSFEAGQYINLKFNIEGQEHIKTYSLASDPAERTLTIGIKQIEDGLISSYINNDIKAGDHLKISLPTGNFTLQNAIPDEFSVGIAAGSGITPILSMMYAAKSRKHGFHLIYGNRSAESIMFKDEIDTLTKENDNISVANFFSRAESTEGIIKSRISGDKFKDYIKSNLHLLKANGFYICGPEAMIIEVSDILKEFGVNENKIKFELFTAPVLMKAKTEEAKENTAEQGPQGVSQVTAILDGEEIDFETDGSKTILENLLDRGYDAPYSCRGAVCCTCRAKVTEGKVKMDANYALSDGEVEEGYVLTCQSRVASDIVKIDYDA